MSTLDQTIAGLNQALLEFTALLEEEAVALAAPDPSALTPLLPRRDKSHRALANHWLKLAQLAGTPSAAGINAMREHFFAKTPPSPAWQELERLAHSAERLNNINGRLIEEKMRRTQIAMQVLQSTLSQRSGVYGADGRVTDFMTSNRKIDSA